MKIYPGNLSSEVTEEEFRQEFEALEKCDVCRHSRSDNRGGGPYGGRRGGEFGDVVQIAG